MSSINKYNCLTVDQKFILAARQIVRAEAKAGQLTKKRPGIFQFFTEYGRLPAWRANGIIDAGLALYN